MVEDGVRQPQNDRFGGESPGSDMNQETPWRSKQKSFPYLQNEPSMSKSDFKLLIQQSGKDSRASAYIDAQSGWFRFVIVSS